MMRLGALVLSVLALAGVVTLAAPNPAAATAPETGTSVLELTVAVAPPRVDPPVTASVTLGQCGDPFPPIVDFEFVKSVDRPVAMAGDVLTYTYSGTNTGTVPVELTQLVDDRLGVLITDPTVATIVQPGQSLSRTITYVATAEDASFGSIDNAAVLTARRADVPEAPLQSAVAQAHVVLEVPQPVDPPQPSVPVGGLAATGSSSAVVTALLGLALAAVGVGLVFTSRSRRADCAASTPDR
jgi:uncharacterized repeat protein (TIGR01451 family)/LPXTG-motif cell wall-anchored protein